MEKEKRDKELKEELANEIKEEFEKELEKKELANGEIKKEFKKKELKNEELDDINVEEIKEKKIELKEEKSELKEVKKKSVFGIITIIIFILLFLVIGISTAIGVMNVNRISENKEPVWCMSNKTDTIDGKKQTICNIGLYVIVKEVDGNKTTATLKPFFMR